MTTTMMKVIKRSMNSYEGGNHPVSPRILDKNILQDYIANLLANGRDSAVLALAEISEGILTGSIHPEVLSDVLTDNYEKLQLHRQIIESDYPYYYWRKKEGQQISGSKERK